jgi:hypothetical protein
MVSLRETSKPPSRKERGVSFPALSAPWRFNISRSEILPCIPCFRGDINLEAKPTNYC